MLYSKKGEWGTIITKNFFSENRNIYSLYIIKVQITPLPPHSPFPPIPPAPNPPLRTQSASFGGKGVSGGGGGVRAVGMRLTPLCELNGTHPGGRFCGLLGWGARKPAQSRRGRPNASWSSGIAGDFRKWGAEGNSIPLGTGAPARVWFTVIRGIQ